MNRSDKLEKLGVEKVYGEKFHKTIIGYMAREILPYCHGESCLILGPSEDGLFERHLSRIPSVTCVDGSSHIIDKICEKQPTYTCVHSLFEDYTPNRKFDLVLLLHVLEHVDDPVGLLSSVKAWVTPSASVIIVVPNAHSIHRLLGVKMNLIKNVHDISESDLRVGHKRVYDKWSLMHDILDAELELSMRKGFFFKPFSNSQMEKLSGEQIEGLYHLGESFQENCAELIAVCYGRMSD